MVDIKNIKCNYSNCNIQPSFNIKGELYAKFCIKHKTDEMFDIRSNICKYINCDIRASYNLPNIKKGIYCKNHKDKNMILVKNNINKSYNKCEGNNCKKHPIFGLEKGKATHCFEHKTKQMFDVAHNICIIEECSTRAIYGKLLGKLTHCYKHREKGMIQLFKKCILCKESARYGINLIPKHCEDHKEKYEINLIEKKCISCNLMMILDKNDMCEFCNPDIFKRTYLSKQNALIEYLNSINLKGNLIDKIINNGECGKERPDIVYDFNDKIIIIECDENQHKQRNYDCEKKRMINIGQSFGGTPVYFIRWNPDKYLPTNNNKLDTLHKRYKLLGEFINNIKNNKCIIPKTFISVFYMYYDNWDSFTNQTWNNLLNFE